MKSLRDWVLGLFVFAAVETASDGDFPLAMSGRAS